MRKYIKNFFIGIFCILIAVIVAFVIKKAWPEEAKAVRPMVTDVNGNSYIEVLGESGETFVAVSDEFGNVWAAEYNADGTVGNTVASLNGVLSVSEIPSVYTGPIIDESVKGEDYTGDVSHIQQVSETQATTSDSSDITTQSTTQEAKKEPLVKKYQDMLDSANYLMEFTFEGDESLEGAPIISAAKNGNIYVETSLEDISAKVIYIAEKDTSYVVIDQLRLYGKLTKELLGEETEISDLNMAEAFFKGIPSSENIEITNVEVAGKQLVCESYQKSNGDIMKYYFDGDTLVRIDSDEVGGVTQTTYISRITSQVDDSLFSLPKGYIYINLDLLGSFV